VPFDEEVAATEELANERLKELHDSIRERVKNGEEIPENEPTYNFAWPVPQDYTINSGVGARWGTYHKGIDINGDHGYEIHACEAGTVIMTNTTCTHDYGKYESCGCGGGYGNFIIIDHGNDFLTLYGHLTKVLVEPGDVVQQGDLIGLMGSTGYSTGDHLHLEIRYQGYVLNPINYVDLSIDPRGGDRPLVNGDDEDQIIVTERKKDKDSETSKVEEKHEESSKAEEESKKDESSKKEEDPNAA
jgi:murein DD-endopeptidase MepM/ murein hydrolase activator NlpD